MFKPNWRAMPRICELGYGTGMKGTPFSEHGHAAQGATMDV
ncbi:hypothetical protein [Paenibacillus sp. FSL W8-0194]